ncbi:MAG: hypothetical protein WBM44_11150, partial [Waterburya sp.]
DEAQTYIQSAPIVGADETGFKQGNADGQNPHNQRAWLWVAVTRGLSSNCTETYAKAVSVAKHSFQLLKMQSRRFLLTINPNLLIHL